MATYKEEIIKRTDGDVIWHNTGSVEKYWGKIKENYQRFCSFVP